MDVQEIPDYDETVAAGQTEGQEQVVETPPEQPPVNPLFEEARSAGIEFGEDITDDTSLARFLLQQYQNDRPYAEYGRSSLSRPEQNSQQGGQEPRDPDVGGSPADDFDEHKFFSEAWNVPQLSQGAQWALKHGVFQEGKAGLLEPAPGLEQAALPYLKEINDYQRAKAQLHESFSDNPIKFLAEKLTPYFQHKLSSQFEQLSQQSTKTYEEQSFVERFKAEHGSWLYTNNGQAYTKHGQEFSNLVSELTQEGMSLQAATKYALRIMPPPAKEGGDPKDPQGTTPTAAPTPDRERNERGQFVKPAPAKAPPAPKKDPTFVEKAKQRAMASHAAVGATHENTVVASEGDLDSMWDSAWRAHAGAN